MLIPEGTCWIQLQDKTVHSTSVACVPFLHGIFLDKLYFVMTFFIALSVVISAFCTSSEKYFQLMEI